MLFNSCALNRCFSGPSVKHYCQIGSLLSWVYSVSRRSPIGGIYCHEFVGI